MEEIETLYYSTHCKHSQHILQYLLKNNIVSNINCICIDKRVTNLANSTTIIILEDSKRVFLPSQITAVPSLISKNKIYFGNDIITYYNSIFQKSYSSSSIDKEPIAADIFTKNYDNIFSEKFTDYNLSSIDNRSLNGYVSANHIINKIATPDDKYKPDKISDDLNIDKLQEIRNKELDKSTGYSNLLQ
jgi:glutaredoxin-related protein